MRREANALDLSPELWLEVASHIDERQYLLHLVLVNRRFTQIFTPALFSNITISFPKEYLYPHLPPGSQSLCSCAALATSSGGRLLQQLESNPELRSYVRSCEVVRLSTHGFYPFPHENNMPKPEYDRLQEAIVALIGRLPLLRSIYFKNSTIRSKENLYLASRPSLQIAIHMLECLLYGDDLIRGPFTASALYLDSLGGLGRPLYPIIFEGVLEKLFLDMFQIDQFCDHHAKAGRPLLAKLTALECSHIPDKHTQLFKSTPSLTSLTFTQPKRLALLDQDNLPNLKSFEGHSSIIPTITAGRPVTTIISGDTPLGGDVEFSELGEHFGSDRAIRSLTWRGCTRPQDLLHYIVSHNPEIQDLRITSNSVTQLCREELLSCLERFKMLKELKTLHFTYLREAQTTANIEWEQEKCRFLQYHGCPDLNEVSFNYLITWKRCREGTVWKPSGLGRCAALQLTTRVN